MAWKRSTVRTRPGPPKRFKHLAFSSQPITDRPESNWSPNWTQGLAVALNAAVPENELFQFLGALSSNKNPTNPTFGI